MKCPTCKVKLLRVQYEGINIRQCSQCQGSLLKPSRFKAIQSRRQKSEDELLDEIVNEGPDSLGKLRCPECMLTMEKRKKTIGSFEFFIDRCYRCEFIWLDKGELAKWQIIFELSDKGEEAERFRQRLANMSAEDKAALDERIANLPEVNLAGEVASGLLKAIIVGRNPLWRLR